ncbi:class IV lanthionine synthetase LanL [Streptomyces sp. RKAG337]|uniref:class IV lanthionine synthetase LanL n=1 Tax=Streptomyces sp. RKAG337 TaxID=2893404 RepID=UPI002033CA64|nr:class IV lanthionine synthetase LanL [Streptomyces sp. RKAG337]MCM2424783.1 class IV lanthionine synthetase LanL [Streptomyces sp. RKAG337]
MPGPGLMPGSVPVAVPGGSAPDLGERLAALVAGHERRCGADEVWRYLFDPRMPAMEHGWKLHVSARSDDFAGTMELLVPVLLRYTCEAKFARSAAVLGELNAGVRDQALIGKAVTVYPRGQDVAALGRELAEVLVGRGGPRVLSDRRVRPDAPVYYRYGPFRAAGAGESALVMTGPDGQSFAGRASTRYRQPPWTQDPFGAAAPGTGRPAARLVGGRYRLTGGIARSPHGDVYRALDTVTGGRVVVKQARAYTGEDEHGVDARGRLRNERAVLAALDGLDGVPRFVDHVRHGEDEYLVTADCGPRDLRRDVLEHGPYGADAHRTGRQISMLARQLLAVLDAVHARGVVVCDLKPGNVVIASDGTCRFVDFGISALGSQRPAGATPGYTLPVYRAGAPPHPADDLYALGATLHYALTGMDPVVVDPDHAVNRDRTLACLDGALPGAAHRQVRALVAGLLSLDPAERVACAGRLRAGLPEPVGGRRPPGPPRITAGLLDDVIAHTVDGCVRASRSPAGPGGRHTGSTVTLYAGSSGVGLELLHHTDHPGVPQAVADLARRTAEHPEVAALTAALYTGRTGVELFLASAADAFPSSHGGPAPADPSGLPHYDGSGDQIGGAAGTGTGLLLLAHLARAAGHQEEAAAHLAAAGRCARELSNWTGPSGEGGSEQPQAPSLAAYDHGFAHGRAGVVHFLYAYHRATADRAAGAAARAGLAQLAADTTGLLAAAARPGASRRYGSWCRGMAGTGTVLITAGSRDEDRELLELGLRCARVCRALAPRMSLVSQCCGLAGVGELLVDAALATGDDGFWRDAEDVAGLILARSGGTARRPLLPDNTLVGSDSAWATGGAGVLSFLRRLRDRGGQRVCGG